MSKRKKAYPGWRSNFPTATATWRWRLNRHVAVEVEHHFENIFGSRASLYFLVEKSSKTSKSQKNFWGAPPPSPPVNLPYFLKECLGALDLDCNCWLKIIENNLKIKFFFRRGSASPWARPCNLAYFSNTCL